MNEYEFYNEIKEKLGEYLPPEIKEECEFKLIENMKNNDTVLHGITITGREGIMTPIVYLDSMYEHYQEGLPMTELLQCISHSFADACKNRFDFELSNFEYENIKDYIVYRIVDMKSNRGRLSELKYSIAGCGLAKIYDINLTDEMRIPITNELVNKFGYEPQKIYEDAERNTPRIYPVDFNSLIEVLRKEGLDMFDEIPANDKEETLPMYILTNRTKTYGAGCLFYPGVKENIAELLNDDYYVLPSSVHETLIVPCSTAVPLPVLELMVKDANASVVAPQEILSDRVMKYDREAEKLLSVSEIRREIECERGQLPWK